MTIRDIAIAFGYEVDNATENKVKQSVNSLKSFATKALGAIGIGISLTQLNAIVEEFQAVNQQIKYATQNIGDQTKFQQEIREAANATRSTYSAMAGTVADLMNTHHKLFQTVEDTAKFAELANKAFKSAGANESEINSLNSAIQNAFTTGKVSAGSFQTMMKSCPKIITYLSKTLEISEQQVKALGTAGAITANQLHTALSSNATAIENDYSQLAFTITDALKYVRNNFGLWLVQLNETHQITQTIAKVVVKSFDVVMAVLKKVVSWFDRLSKRLGGTNNLIRLIAISAGGVFASLKSGAIVGFLRNIGSLLSGINLKVILIVAAVLAVLLVVEDFVQFLKGNGSITAQFFESIGVNAEEMREKLLAVLNDCKTSLLEAWGEIKSALGEAWESLKPALKELVYMLVNLIVQILPVVCDLLSTVARIFGNVAKTVLPVLAKILSRVISIFSDLAGDILPIVTDLLNKLMPVIEKFISDVLPPLVDFVSQIISLVLDVIEDVLPVLIEMMSELAPVFADIVGSILPMLAELINLILPILKNIISLLKPLLDLVTSIAGPLRLITRILKTVLSTISPIIEVLTNLLGSVLKPIINVLLTISDILGGVFSGAVSFAVEKLQPLFDILSSILGFAGNLLGGALNGVTGFVGSIVNGVGGVFNGLAEGGYIGANTPVPVVIGDNKAEGEIVSPISKMKNTVLEALRMFAYSAKPVQAARTLTQETSNRTITQNVHITNQFNGGTTQAQKDGAKAMKKSSGDATAEMARALAYAR